MLFISVAVTIILVIAILAFVTVRQQWKSKDIAFDDAIVSAFTSPTLSDYDQIRESGETKSSGSYEDLESIIGQRYDDCYIPGRGEQEIEAYFCNLANEAFSLGSKLETFHIEPSFK